MSLACAVGTIRRGRHRRKRARIWRFFVLHARARHVFEALAGSVVAALVTWLVATALLQSESSDGPIDRLPIVVGGPLVAAAAVSAGLGGADEELERTTPARWPLLRLAHVVVMACVVSVALILIGLWEPRTYGAFELARNTVGFMGLACVGAAVMSAKLCWTLPFGYAVVVYAVAASSLEKSTWWWTWPLQLSDVAQSFGAALAVFAVGSGCFMMFGGRVVRTDVTL